MSLAPIKVFFLAEQASNKENQENSDAIHM
jgi:hypothetical protein